MKKIEYTPIGIIKSPFEELEGMPIQPIGAAGAKGEVHIKNQYWEGLDDLERFSHIILIYHFHLSKGFELKVKPYLDRKKRGIFATRAPKRPNPIGLSVVRLDKIKENIIYISNIDVLDGTPLLDIKPYIPQIEKEEYEKVSLGWLEDKYHKIKEKKSDNRFISK
jgi:tRNA (adenine37-N6)-methyltransferase